MVNICSKNEHEPKIEWKICHTKERCQCITADNLASILPSVIVMHLVLHVVMFLNAYPDAQGLSNALLPGEIILCWNLDYAHHCRTQFGSYCIAYNEPNANKTNIMKDLAW